MFGTAAYSFSVESFEGVINNNQEVLEAGVVLMQEVRGMMVGGSHITQNATENLSW